MSCAALRRAGSSGAVRWSRCLGLCRPLLPKHAGRVPTGWALICHQTRIILKRRNPDHLVHCSIASGARHLRHLFDRSDTIDLRFRASFDERQRVIERIGFSFDQRQSSSPPASPQVPCEFLNLSQSGERPDRWRELSRFDAIPSRPILQASWKDGAIAALRAPRSCQLFTMIRAWFGSAASAWLRESEPPSRSPVTNYASAETPPS